MHSFVCYYTVLYCSEPDFDDMELHVSVSVKSPYDEDQQVHAANAAAEEADPTSAVNKV